MEQLKVVDCNIRLANHNFIHCIIDDLMDVEELKKEIVRIGRVFYQRGWSLATSSNYSAKVDERRILITASGKDKGTFTEADILMLNLDGTKAEESLLKPSAESRLHCVLYEFQSHTGAILHTHSAFSTVLSTLPEMKAPITIGSYEMLKAFEGVQTHLHTEQIPVFANDQNIDALSENVIQYLRINGNIHGFLIAGHGLYSWGNTLQDALRHVEAFEFLMECEYRKMYLR